MKSKNIKGVVIVAALISFVSSPAISEAGGFDLFKRSPKKAEKKIAEPKKERTRVKPARKAKQKKPLFAFLGRELVIGVEETYIAERELEHSNFPEGEIQIQSLQHLGTLSYEIVDGLTLKGKIGTAQIKNKSWGYGKHDYELAWGAGGEWNLFKCLNKCFPKIPATLPYEIDMLVSGEYFTISSDKETISSGSSLEEDWQEWNVSIAFSRNWGAFTPYIGTRISWAEVKAKLDQNISGVENFDGTLKADDNVGGFVGTDIDFSKCGKLGNIPFVRDLSANFEVRAFDELAFTGGLNYIFQF